MDQKTTSHQDPAPDLTAVTPLLDHDAQAIRALIHGRGWAALSPADRIAATHAFVRDEIAFGYNACDAIPASRVLAQGYGQCNTKGILLMALLRALGLPCRVHGFTIVKSLQRGIVPETVYTLAPDEIVHSWVEVLHNGRWLRLEGFILDAPFLAALRRMHPAGPLCAYGIGTAAIEKDTTTWQGGDTFIQSTGITRDLGLFDAPDALFAAHAQALGGLRRWLYAHVIRHWMNARVRAIRAGRVPAIPGGPGPAPEPLPLPPLHHASLPERNDPNAA